MSDVREVLRESQKTNKKKRKEKRGIIPYLKKKVKNESTQTGPWFTRVCHQVEFQIRLFLSTN